eukprot:12365.XXX_74976_75086_1 [CDS] Oithona nana genome sequencing.
MAVSDFVFGKYQNPIFKGFSKHFLLQILMFLLTHFF